MRRAGKIDTVQRDIVHALRQAGCPVFVASGVGNGFPDLVVGGWNRYTDMPEIFLLELKTPGRERFTEAERRFFETWKSWHLAGKVVVVHTIEEALRAVGRLR